MTTWYIWHDIWYTWFAIKLNLLIFSCHRFTLLIRWDFANTRFILQCEYILPLLKREKNTIVPRCYLTALHAALKYEQDRLLAFIKSDKALSVHRFNLKFLHRFNFLHHQITCTSMVVNTCRSWTLTGWIEWLSVEKDGHNVDGNVVLYLQAGYHFASMDVCEAPVNMHLVILAEPDWCFIWYVWNETWQDMPYPQLWM